ncbi:MAG: DUF5689 domain-containing protein [Flavobacteriaceae bacterium]|nr:DUF5689 domain-containing protein [Flavobacteriaceae bacterium]
MNKFKLIKKALYASVVAIAFTGCVQDDDYSTPPINCNDRWQANADIPAIKALNATDTPLKVTENIIFEGYVVSSDQTGNFFKTMSVQNSLTNPTAGLQIEMDMTNLYTFYPIGSRVVVDVNGLYVAKDRGTYKVGYEFDSNGVMRVGRMSEDMALSHVSMTCDPVGEVVPVSYATISEAMNEANLNTLIKLENVQFQSAGAGQTYYDPNNAFGGATNVTVVDSQGTTMVLRNSAYADFAAEILPDGSGSLTAVLSAYSNSNNVTPSTYQLFIRDTSDVQFDQPRIEIVNGEGPIGGSAATYSGCINEGFESFNVDLVNFSNYVNYAYNGDRYWSVKSFGNNKYIQMTSHNSNGENEVYFIVPVNFDEADSFSFKTKDGYNNGNVLSVYYTTNWQIGSAISPSSFTNITSNFNISSGNTNGYGSTFIDSGSYDLSSISGNGAIVFGYKGTGGGITTTMQIDDIHVVDNQNADCGGEDPGEEPGEPGENAVGLFAGYNFENWNAFLGGLNSFGIKSYANQSAGTGRDGSASLHISTTPTTTNTNDYVFTTLATDGMPSTYSKVSFYMKGSSEKSVSLNLYVNETTYHTFNLASISSSSTIAPSANNQYTGTIDTGGNWILVTLDLSTINDLNTSNTAGNLFALKIGRNANYDLHFDNFVIE